MSKTTKIKSKKQQLKSIRFMKNHKRRVLVADWYQPEYQESNWYDMDFYQEDVSQYAFDHMKVR